MPKENFIYLTFKHSVANIKNSSIFSCFMESGDSSKHFDYVPFPSDLSNKPYRTENTKNISSINAL